MDFPKSQTFFQKQYHVVGKARARNDFQASRLVTRMHATENSLLGLAGRHILPFLEGSFEVNGASSFIIGGPLLKFLGNKGKTSIIPCEGWNPDVISHSPQSQKTFLSATRGILTFVALALLRLWPLLKQTQASKPSVIIEMNRTSTKRFPYPHRKHASHESL